MKFYKITSVFFLIYLLSSCSGQVIQRKQAQLKAQNPEYRKQFDGIRKRVALLNFFNETPFGNDDLGITAASELATELSRTGEFIIDPMAMKIFGNSKEIYAGGGSKLVQLSRQARIAGINFVLFGRVMEARVRENTDEIGLMRKSKAFSEAKVEIRIFDINANKEIYNEILTGFADDNTLLFFTSDRSMDLERRRDLLRYAVRVAVRKSIPRLAEIASKLDWVGRVAKILDNKIYINAGRESGIHISDVLKVMTEGTEIFDPETGGLIGMSKGEVKGTLEVIDYFGNDGAIAILHTGGAVHEGDFVKLY